jgi:hypothetical protein
MIEKSARYHVTPVNDLREHVVDPDIECWCHPAYEEDGRVVIHNSLDQRERYETGELKPN